MNSHGMRTKGSIRGCWDTRGQIRLASRSHAGVWRTRGRCKTCAKLDKSSAIARRDKGGDADFFGCYQGCGVVERDIKCLFSKQCVTRAPMHPILQPFESVRSTRSKIIKKTFENKLANAHSPRLPCCFGCASSRLFLFKTSWLQCHSVQVSSSWIGSEVS